MHLSERSAPAVDALALAAQWGRRNRWLALRERQRALLPGGLIVIAAGIATAFALHANAGSIAPLLARAIDYPLVVIVIIAWLVANTVARLRRTARRDATRSWLAALPMDTTTFERHARRRIGIGLLIVALLAGTLLVTVAGLVTLPTRALATALMLVAAALVLGAAVGWSLGGQPPKPSRLRLLAAGSARRDAHYSLGRWPLRHSRAHADIGLHARAIGAMLLSLPMGVPAIAALCVIVIGLMAFASWDLARGLLATVTQAGAWLRSLPLPPRRAAIALGLPAWTALVGALMLLAAALLPSRVGTATALAIVIGGAAITAIACTALCLSLRPFGARP